VPYSTIDDLPDFDLEFEDSYIDECLAWDEDEDDLDLDALPIDDDDDERDDPYNDHNAPVYWLH
jgi:hypothetical protein